MPSVPVTILSPKASEKLANIIKTNMTRGSRKEQIFSLERLPSTSLRYPSEMAEHSVMFYVNTECYLKEIELLAWQVATYNRQYEERVEVVLSSSNSSVVATAMYHGQVHVNENFMVTFDPPCPIQPNEIYTMHVYYTNSDKGYWCFDLDNRTYESEYGVKLTIEEGTNTNLHTMLFFRTANILGEFYSDC